MRASGASASDASVFSPCPAHCGCSLVVGHSLAFTASVKDMSWCSRFVSVIEFGVDEKRTYDLSKRLVAFFLAITSFIVRSLNSCLLMDSLNFSSRLTIASVSSSSSDVRAKSA